MGRVGVDRDGGGAVVVAALGSGAQVAVMKHGALRQMVSLVGLCVLLLAPRSALANGHGPLFGLATPTNGEGGWTLDTTFMGRGGGGDNASAFGTMLTYGITPDLQISGFAPALLTTTSLSPSQMTSMMPAGSGAYEGLLAWRFQRDDFAPGSRYESTAYAGLLLPGPQNPAGLQGKLGWAPGFYTALTSGLASRSNYLWYGAGFTHYAMADGDRRSDYLFYSLVYGYRPEALRADYPHWDGRFFLEMTGEHFDRVTFNGVPLSGTAGDDLFLGQPRSGSTRTSASKPASSFRSFAAAARYMAQKLTDGRSTSATSSESKRRDETMKLKGLTIISGVLTLGLLMGGTPARAELRHIDLTTFGMD